MLVVHAVIADRADLTALFIIERRLLRQPLTVCGRKLAVHEQGTVPDDDLDAAV